MADDAALVRLAQSGERAAFDALAMRYRGLVLGIMRRHVPDAEVEDLAQEALARAWIKLPSLREPRAFPAWLSRMAMNIARRWHKRAGCRMVPFDEDTAFPCPTFDPLETMLHAEKVLELRAALLELSLINRQALIMHQWGHYTYPEIAQCLDLPRNTVAARIHRAKGQLRRRLGYTTPAVCREGKHMAQPQVKPERPQLVLQVGHSGLVMKLAISPDGRWLASSDNANLVIFWNLTTGEERLRIAEDGVRQIAWSPDSRLLAIAAGDRTVIRNIDDGLEVITLAIGPQQVCFTTDGGGLWSASMTPDPEAETLDFTNLFRWDLSSGRIVERHEHLSGGAEYLGGKGLLAITVVGRRLDEKGLAVPLDRAELYLWNVPTGELLRQFSGLTGSPNTVAISPDGSLLASASWVHGTPHDVLVWEVATGAPRFSLPVQEEQVASLAFSPDGALLAAGDLDGIITCWDTRSGECIRRLESTDRADGLAFSPDRRRLFVSAAGSAAGFGAIAEWDLAAESRTRTLPSRISPLFDLAVNPADGTLITSTWTHQLAVWSLGKPVTMRELAGEAGTRLQQLAIRPDGKQLLAKTAIPEQPDKLRWEGRRVLQVWDLVAGQIERTLSPEGDGVTTVVYSPDGAWAATGKNDRTILLWDAATWEIERNLTIAGLPTHLAFSPDGRHLAGAGSISGGRQVIGDIRRAELLLWELESGTTRDIWADDSRSLTCLSMHPNERLLAAGIWNPWFADAHVEVLIWSLPDGRQAGHYMLPGTRHHITHLAYSPDGNLLAGCARDLFILWDANTGEIRCLLKHQAGLFISMAFLPDNRRLLTSGWDGVVKVWDIHSLLREDTPREQATLAHLSTGDWLAFTSEGYYTGSKEIEQHLRWRVGSELYPGDRFAGEYRKPEAVERVLSDE